MKNIFLWFIFGFAFLASCKKENTQTNQGTFLIYKTSASGNWSVLINGNDYGMVPYTIVVPTCESTSPGLKIKMNAGTYSIDFKNWDGYAWGNPKSITLKDGECKPYKLQ